MSAAFAAVILFVTVAAGLSAFAYLPAVAVVETLSPRRASARAAVWFWALVLPVVGGLAGAAVGLYSSLHDAYGSPHLYSDRPHLCSRWLTAAPDVGFATWLVADICAVIVAAALVRFVVGVVRSQLLCGRLRRSSPAGGTVVMVDSRPPLLATVGVVKPVVLVTSGTANLLETAEIRAALAHEMAHVARGDNLRESIVGLCADLLLLMPSAYLFARYWREEAERSCDDAAAQAAAPGVVACAMDKLAQAAGSEAGRRFRASTGARWRHAAVDTARRAERLRRQAQTVATPLSRELLFIGIVLVVGAVAAIILGIAATAQQAMDTLRCLADSLLRVL